MPFIIKYWKYIALILAVLSLLGALWGYGAHKYQKGYDDAMAKVATAEAEANSKITQRKRKETHNAKNLDSDGVNRELCKYGWMRDIENCPK